MEKIKVLIVDDSLTIRAMFEELLERDPGFQVVGTAASAEEAMRLVHRMLPDVVALDIAMPGTGGMALLDQMRDFWHDTAFVMVSSSTTQDAPICKEAFDRGAFACFDKSYLIANKAKLVCLLKEAATGRVKRAGHRGDGTTLPTPDAAGI
ncbi:response regulator [Sphingobium aquiterrae]|uniref:response regulator n=1 Tax=Sphingobium aquiterrae TaxID=2038656 RepID=UPI003016B1DA